MRLFGGGINIVFWWLLGCNGEERMYVLLVSCICKCVKLVVWMEGKVFVVGIDLGILFLCVGVFWNGKVDIIVND